MSIQDTIASVGADAVSKIVSDPTIAISKDGNATAFDVKEAGRVVATEMQPVIQHLTNSEPWYASRVTLGALFGVVGSFCAAFGIRWLTPEQQTATINLVAVLGPVVAGAGLTLYGRWAAKKPIGA